VGGILNEADLSRSVKENAVTIKRYRTILDLLFLTLTVPPWFRNIGKRLIKSPKAYLMDTNLVCFMLGCRLADIEKNDPNLFGHLLENFVATELLKQIAEPIHQAGLYHFRTGDGREVDFVIEFSDQKLVGIEVKSSDKVSLKDCAGLLELQEKTGSDFVMGCVLYRGQHILKMSDKLWALPMSVLWL
jgi:predicted AAA+ superfamily ATPase